MLRTEDAVQIVNSFITISITGNYNHSQLFLTLLCVYTIIILTRSWLQSLFPLLHVYTAYKPYTLIFTALLHIESPNRLTTSSLADLSAINYCLKLSHTLHLHTSKLSPRSHSANSPLFKHWLLCSHSGNWTKPTNSFAYIAELC
jgi:hypothetical protein